MLTASSADLALLCLAAYLLGSIPFGLVVGRVVRGVDLRQVGSGNIGAANAFRSLGAPLGVAVLALDAVKGYLPVTLAGTMFALLGRAGSPCPATAQVLVGVSAIVGHNSSIYLRFKGGKGIATMFGVLLAMSPTATLVAALVWAVALALTRYASVGSLCAAASIPVYFAWSGAPSPHLMFGVVACAMAFVRHRSNIRNLIAGRELRFGAGGQGSSPAGETAEGMKAAP